MTSCIFDSPIERIRGSEQIRVSVRANFKIQGLDYEVSGIALTKSDSSTALQEAYDSAILDAEANLRKILSRNGNLAGNKVMSNFLKELLQPKVSEEKVKREEMVMNDPKVLDKDRDIQRLQGPTDEIRQKKINELCETLGIEPICVMGDEPWTLLESLALITELEAKTSRFESKNKPGSMKVR